MTKLVADYGYGDTGESISIGDPKEAWILEIVGTGGRQGGGLGGSADPRRPGLLPRQHCAHRRVPPRRSGQLPSRPTSSTFAAGKGWYEPKSGKPLRFREAYCPADAVSPADAARRAGVEHLRRAAPSKDLSLDYRRSSPRRALSAVAAAGPQAFGRRRLALMRDHYEGTEFDMTRGVDAGPFGCRCVGHDVEVDGADYAWERPISTSRPVSPT